LRKHHESELQPEIKQFFVLLIWLLLLAGLLTMLPCKAHTYYDETHKAAVAAAIRLVRQEDEFARSDFRPFCLYSEIYSPEYERELVAGAGDSERGEDYGSVNGNERSFRHYYDPITGRGVAWYLYFYAWEKLENAKVKPPAGGYYENALEWARNGAGTDTSRNWEGAISAYDYTESSKKEAFYRLGHVLHLVADMADPDHATSTPHAGSGFTWPDVTKKVHTFIDSIEDLSGEWRMSLKLYIMAAVASTNTKKHAGFERLIEDGFAEPALLVIPEPDFTLDSKPGSKIIKKYNFDFYFDRMATVTQQLMVERGIPLPIGLQPCPPGYDRESEFVRYLKDLVKERFEDYFFFPAIPLENVQVRKRYEHLALDLLSYATSLNAGLLEYFHDTVNQPPFVRRLTIVQDGGVKYKAEWEDVLKTVDGIHDAGNGPYFNYKILDKRRLRKKQQDEPIIAGRPATLVINFGPESAGNPERVERLSLEVLLGEAALYQGGLNADQTTYTCRFTPQYDAFNEFQQLRIKAKDIHDHINNRSVGLTPEQRHHLSQGYLDVNPGTPARVTCYAPYDWQGYETGYDMNHRIKVKKEKSIETMLFDEEDVESSVFTKCPTPVPEGAKHYEGPNFEYWKMSNGKYVGPYRKWYDNKKTKPRLFKCYDTKGLLSGPAVRWFRKTGKMSSHEIYEEDKLNGLCVNWYEDPYGEKSVVEWKDHKRHGICITFRKNKKPEKEQRYDNGQLKEETLYDVQGYKEKTRRGEILTVNKTVTGTVIKFFKNERQLPSSLENFKNEKPDGTQIVWHEKPYEKKSYSQYKDGKRDGIFKTWEKDGTPLSYNIYKNNKLIKRTIYSKGKPTKVLEYSNGKLVPSTKLGAGK
jgi:antitoxin component YwqK of YwqJK toxin-antitoxin module